jgi:hypothetical protein
MESPVDDPESTLASFNRQFGLNASREGCGGVGVANGDGNTMFAVVNTDPRSGIHEGGTVG